MKINHELCSELLGPFLRGELDDVRHQEVEAHLASCTECSEELRALQALNGEPEDVSLSELESARLHREVWAAVGAAPRQERKSLGARLVPYLGTAAVLALFAVGAVTLGGGEADERGSDAASEMESLDAIEDQDLGASQEEAGDAAGGGDGAEGTRMTAESSPPVEDSTALEAEAADETGVSNESVATFDSTATPRFKLGCRVGLGVR